ncbi:MAG: hypothetical protein J6R04_06465 [Clostridia bacterium]|nr:hypothetical protein [Clostridia bacterium]
MGWGPLFFGYFLAFVPGQNVLLSTPMLLIGGGFMLWGLIRLSRYCHTFRYATLGVVLMMATALLGAGLLLVMPPLELSTETLGVADWLRVLSESGRYVWLDWIRLLFLMLFHVALAFSVKEIALRVGVEKNAVRALRNLVLLGVYVLAIVLQSSGVGIAHLAEVATIVLLIVSVCNSVMLYSCYMRIAPAEGEDAEDTRKPSRFAFVNRFRAKMQEREDKAREADRAYSEQQMREEREKQLSRMSKKQRQREEARDRNRK